MVCWWCARSYLCALVVIGLTSHVESVGFFIPRHLSRNSSASTSEINDATDKALRAGSVILWAGCFLFISFVGAIWIWLAANSRRSLPHAKVTGGSLSKQDEDQKGAKSPIRSLGRAQRVANKPVTLGSEEV